MTGAPGAVDPKQLRELGIKTDQLTKRRTVGRLNTGVQRRVGGSDAMSLTASIVAGVQRLRQHGARSKHRCRFASIRGRGCRWYCLARSRVTAAEARRAKKPTAGRRRRTTEVVAEAREDGQARPHVPSRKPEAAARRFPRSH